MSVCSGIKKKDSSKTKKVKSETDDVFDFIKTHNSTVEENMTKPLTPEQKINRDAVLRQNEYDSYVLTKKVDKCAADCVEATELYIINLDTGRKVKKHTKLGLKLLGNKNYRAYTEDDFYNSGRKGW